jgi:hypothetical protein
MNFTVQSFYKNFYGHKFFRYFRRPLNYERKGIPNQFIVTNAKQLYVHVDRNSGVHPCYLQIYDRGLIGNLKRNNPDKMIFDRAFFDFDVSNPKVHKVKKRLRNNEPGNQRELQEELRNLIIEDRIAKPAVDEAKDFAIKFEECFKRKPMLFFSGCKGAHAYTFFEPIHQFNMNRALSWFASNVKDVYDYKTLDLAVNKDAQSRVSRIPYSKHQDTGLNVVPFTVGDSYEEIIGKSLHPVVEPFTGEDYKSSLGEHLETIWPLIEYNDKFEEAKIKAAQNLKSNHSSKVDDHKEFFRNILGEPVKEYPDKDYIMYKCPFKDHDDNNPSFMIYKTGYKCYGCNRKGNYFQFFKDYYGWTNQQVQTHLRTKKLD